ncbi:hypothetical protein CDD80_5843 [Ophiocordyceps camponoti-rufipedis]|uniref:Inositolphosphotransferase Aur1/Ipt1 domain-containing protein n=1 Tax=Ophiocordyceps camponoti-rufipedis TaxID=2004952 RepID=A0A2C5ZM61_9HYPO|nr:hypothetical protein CDD80_5843 [Ophiocordyceps camponoti-rufipedis]
MVLGAVLEPLVVVTLLFGGAWVNRSRKGAVDFVVDDYEDDDDLEGKRRRSGSSSWSGSSDATFATISSTRTRRVRLLKWEADVSTPNTAVFANRGLSRLLRKFPFLVEAWYWALIYWVYQVARAVTALTLVEGTVDVARKHALQVIHLEQQLGILLEPQVQRFFLSHPLLLHWTNRVYSFIHIPGTIFFLVSLFYLTTTTRRASPALYEARRRSMAMCNLVAFVVFTVWPCMPPRLLSDAGYRGEDAAEAKGYGFVDTVHSKAGESSVWTTNRFCNQYAAMPSLHFGYSLLIGLTIATLPLPSLRWTSWKRLAIVAVGIAYPTLILTAIVATANHFILDAVAGALVCAFAWRTNDLLLNLLVLEDYFLCLLRIHKPGNDEVLVGPDTRRLLKDET